MKPLALTVAICLLPFTTLAQPDKEAGVPFVKWFSPLEYGGSPQVFSFEQDDRGILYIGHGFGILEYDGTSWRSIATPHGTVVRSMARGPGGRIFLGEVGDFGYLRPDKSGQMQFASLLEFIPPQDRDFQDVRRTYSAPEGIYFQSPQRLFLLTPNGQGWRTKVWKATRRLGFSGPVFGTYYISVSGIGLHRVNGDSLELLNLPGLEKSPGMAIVSMVPLSRDPEPRRILVATRNGQLHLLDDRGLTPFSNDGGWEKLGIARLVVLPDGAIGVGTLVGGFGIMEPNGRTRRYLDRSAGIASDGVLNAFVDRGGTTWVGLQNGLCKVESVSPFSEFGSATGISAAVTGILRYRGVLHVATMSGVRYFDPPSSGFRTLPGSANSSIFGLLVHGDSLLATTGNEGIMEIRGSTAKPSVVAAPGVSYFGLAVSRQDPKRVWLGTGAGLSAMRLDPTGRWVDEGIIVPGPEVRSIVEPEPGLLWLGTQSQGVMRVQLKDGSLKDPEVKRFRGADGLAGNGGVSVHLAAGRVLFASRPGVREFDAATNRFVPSKLFGALATGGAAEEYTVAVDRPGNLWVNFGLRPVWMEHRPDGSYRTDEARMRRVASGATTWLFADEDGVVWTGGESKLIRYDPRKEVPANQSFPALVRRVTAGVAQKTVVYGGSGDAPEPHLDYSDNTVRFEFAAASLEDPSANQFQSMLEGFDRDWSPWTKESRRDYTNLPPGSFRFRVKARNAFLQESTEGDYSLQILPPWYRSWWAFALYALALIAAVQGAIRILRSRVIARERQRSMLREAELRAETAAAEAKTLQAENERKKNVELLSEIGKDITSSLNLDTIFYKLYEHCNKLMDAAVFGVGLYHPERHQIEYLLAVERGKRYAPFTRDTLDRNQFPVWCIENRKPVFLNDVSTEYSKYIERYQEPEARLEDGTLAGNAHSMMYLPLIAKDRVLGIIGVQSFSRNAYTDYHLDLLENLASYTAIALDNADAYLHLKSAQEQLVVQEKLASLGALTAGIAHEIKNPLNFVNNFADLSVELMEELREEVNNLEAGRPADVANMKALIDDLSGNARKINEHGKRADGIVRSMLLHSRGQSGERQPTDINAMIEEYAMLSYHGMRAQDSSFNVTIVRELSPQAGKVEAIPQDLSRVFLNILNNACYAVHEKTCKAPASYKPTLLLRTIDLGQAVEVRVRDNGMGIPPEVRDKIFNPFFTTKPTGQGTGLGLSISHDIVVQQHGGQLEVETEAGEFTEFVVRLPRTARKAA